VLEFRDEAGRFTDAEVRLIEEGPLRATLRVISYYGHSMLRQDFTLYRNQPGAEVSVMLNWQERHKLLKLAFPVNVSGAKPVYEIPYGALERPADGLEQPGQAWVDISGKLEGGSEYGLALANTSKYSYDALGSELRMTAVRSPMYADHYGVRDEFAEYMDQGMQYFTYLLLPHAGDWRQSGIVRRSQELLNPPVTVLETYHKGSLPLTGSFLSVESENVAAPVLKQAEDGDGLILRCVETFGETVETEIDLKLTGRKWKARFGPFEIKTFRIRDNGNIEETNLIEGI
jgi:alpha-mannosidase